MDSSNCYKLIFTRKFVKEIDKIYEYIVDKLYSKNSANRLLLQINNNIKLITIFLKAYSKIKNEYRKLIVKNYIIIFKVCEKRKEVHVVHIFYSKSNYI